MTDPKQLQIELFDYHLPEEKIASFPKEERDGSKLLIWKNNVIRQEVFRIIPSLLPENSLIIFNNTRVVEARLLFQKPTGAKIEIFCLEPGDIYPDITTALGQHGSVTWKCLVGNAASWTPGLMLEKIILVNEQPVSIKATLLKKENAHFIIHLSWTLEYLSFAELLHHAGSIPLPPYIKRSAQVSDAERYQTVYAHFSGSVAAPTAGLHFTEEIIAILAEKNIQKGFVTLHVGAGTFKPVKASIMHDHEMHSEFIEISLSLIQQVYDHYEKNIIAVGTTSLRTLESLYWLGRKLFIYPDLTEDQLQVGQWEPYEQGEQVVSVHEALQALMQHIIQSGTDVLVTKTALLIAPGYSFKIVNTLITNFHQPRSTLLLLVSAFIGEEWKSVYAYALENDFRFLSYGDVCLLFRQ
jgi:S-adenosylmethionine:tRNA ribosyltransferase-isomerase